MMETNSILRGDNMYNGEELDYIIIKNKDGKIIATLDANNLTCDNKKFKIMDHDYEDVLVIQLNQKTYN